METVRKRKKKVIDAIIKVFRPHCSRMEKFVVTQFWIHQDFLECYFVSIIIYKNPKKLRKRKIQKIYFSRVKAVIFDQNRVHRVNTGQTMSTRVKK
jgi:hypothetical protein